VRFIAGRANYLDNVLVAQVGSADRNLPDALAPTEKRRLVTARIRRELRY